MRSVALPRGLYQSVHPSCGIIGTLSPLIQRLDAFHILYQQHILTGFSGSDRIDIGNSQHIALHSSVRNLHVICQPAGHSQGRALTKLEYSGLSQTDSAWFITVSLTQNSTLDKCNENSKIFKVRALVYMVIQQKI